MNNFSRHEHHWMAWHFLAKVTQFLALFNAGSEIVKVNGQSFISPLLSVF
jgi:hypothetical protein